MATATGRNGRKRPRGRSLGTVLDSTQEHRRSAWPHRFAVVLTVTTFPLIWVGGLVTTYDAGMAVPDWPTTYGYNLFLYPWQTWVAGPWDLFIEHGHRLLGAVVGLLTIAMVAAVWKWDHRRWMRTASVAAMVGVIAQGVLGGFRVVLDERVLALLHGCIGPAFFAYCAMLCVFTSRRWQEATTHQTEATNKKIRRLAILTTGLAYLQLILGAHLRHIPFHDPVVFPVLVFFHLIVAVALVVHGVLLLRIAGGYGKSTGIASGSWLLAMFMFGQVSLGAATWIAKYGWPSWFSEFGFAARYVVAANTLSQAIIVTGHVALGSLILATSAMISSRVLRVVQQRPLTSMLAVPMAEAVA